jgi:hypothetical protein
MYFRRETTIQYINTIQYCLHLCSPSVKTETFGCSWGDFCFTYSDLLSGCIYLTCCSYTLIMDAAVETYIFQAQWSCIYNQYCICSCGDLFFYCSTVQELQYRPKNLRGTKNLRGFSPGCYDMKLKHFKSFFSPKLSYYILFSRNQCKKPTFTKF